MSKTDVERGNSNMLKGVLMLCICALIAYIYFFKVDLFLSQCFIPKIEVWEVWRYGEVMGYDLVCFLEHIVIKLGLLVLGFYAGYKGIKNIGD